MTASEATAAAPDTAAPEAPATRADRWVTVLLIGLVMLPFVVSAVALLGSAGADYHPYQDHAIIEWRTRDLFDHVPLVGPYSRFGWFHPGPALFAATARRRDDKRTNGRLR